MTNTINEKTGKPVDLSYLECGLPDYLKESINNLILNENTLRYDLYIDELYADFHRAEQEGLIDEEQSNYLRKKYLGYC